MNSSLERELQAAINYYQAVAKIDLEQKRVVSTIVKGSLAQSINSNPYLPTSLKSFCESSLARYANCIVGLLYPNPQEMAARKYLTVERIKDILKVRTGEYLVVATPEISFGPDLNNNILTCHLGYPAADEVFKFTRRFREVRIIGQHSQDQSKIAISENQIPTIRVRQILVPMTTEIRMHNAIRISFYQKPMPILPGFSFKISPQGISEMYSPN